MGVYETESGYICRETIEGLEVKENDKYVCTLHGVNLDSFRVDDDEFADIDDDKLEAAIKEEIEVLDIIAANADY
jgi:hypothetical protein